MSTRSCSLYYVKVGGNNVDFHRRTLYYLLAVSSPLTHNEVLDEVELFAIDINRVFVDQVFKHHLGALLMCPRGPRYGSRDELIVKYVTEWSMA